MRAAVLALLLVVPARAQDPMELLSGTEAPPHGLWLETLDLEPIAQGWGSPRAGRSVDGNPLRPGGRLVPRGVGTHAESEWEIDLKGAARRFLALAGKDAEVGTYGAIAFQAWVDGKLRQETRVLKGADAPVLFDLDLRGARRLALVVTDGGDGIDYDHADWGGALLLLDPAAAARPATLAAPPEPPPDLARGVALEPRLNHPRIAGATPGRPFLFRIPASGEKPLRFAVRGLPPGLALDPATGLLTGSLAAAGVWLCHVTVANGRGEDAATLVLVGGEHRLALTPPMGWNSWNVWGGAVDQAKVLAAAEAMAATGLIEHGYQYINIDDCWEGKRDDRGVLRPNEKFPDLAGLADRVHALGLKLGIYSSPGPQTCAGFAGSHGHEEIDARTWAEWGIDYVKYDWCSYSRIARDGTLPELQKPYRIMRAALDRCGRDIVYSLCQYGMGRVWEWGAEVGGNLWRTTGDIADSWPSLAAIGFGQDGKENCAGPGLWNDPDMLVVGWVGWGPRLRPTRLTQNEQVTHVTLWCLLAAPLLLGCDLSRLDDFTLALLTNDEVIGVDQDPLGRQARRVARAGSAEVWARPLADGTLAVGLFNRGREPASVRAAWADLGLQGPKPVRNLWTHMDLGEHAEGIALVVPRHGAALLKVGPSREE